MKWLALVLGMLYCMVSLAAPVSGSTAAAKSRETEYQRYVSLGSPFGIQDLTEVRLGDYSNLVDAGAMWVRLEGLNGLNWALVEEVEGVFDWSQTDALIRELTQEGFQILWTVSSYHPSSGSIHYLPEDMDGYLEFFSAAVERYDGDGVADAPGSPVVTTFQIENEVDGHFWEDTAANYARLLKESIRVAKEANPTVKIAIAGASTPEDYYRFYPEIFAEFGPDDSFFDVMDVHWYESVGDYAVHPKRGIGLVDFLADLREALGDVEIWFTEVGTHTGTTVDPSKAPQTERQQASELVKRYAHFVGNGVAKVFWHSMLESRAYTKSMNQNDFFDNIGLIYNGFSYVDGRAVYQRTGVGEDSGDGIKKLAYYSYKLLSENLANYDWVDVVQQDNDAYVYRFRVDGRDVWIAWIEGGGTLSLPAPGASRVRVTEAVPNVEAGIQLEESSYPAFFDATTVFVEQGIVDLTLGELPILIETDLAK